MAENEAAIGNEFEPPVNVEASAPMTVQGASKAVAEVQAAVIMAKQFPRDKYTVFNNIIKDCARRSLAEVAVYAYPRGGQTISGASIKLAVVMAQNWGNLDYGVRELSRDDGKSVAEAYCWDLETNVRSTMIFEVPHIRSKRSGNVKLTDPRDIYEMVANQGARRLRACILRQIPEDVQEKAVERCKQTITASDEPIEDRVRTMVVAFDKLGVKQEHIEEKIGHKCDIITADELFDLRTIYNAIKDGQKRSAFFKIADTAPSDTDQAIKVKLKAGGKKKTEPDNAEPPVIDSDSIRINGDDLPD